MYRPQFPYPTPRGYVDRDITQYFDYLTVPLLNNSALATQGMIHRIALTLQPDYPFLWRGIKIIGVNGADPVVTVQFYDPSKNELSRDFVPIDLYTHPSGSNIWGFQPVPLEPCIPCPKGSTVWMSVYNQTGSNQDLTKIRVGLFGLKRYPAREAQ